MKITSYIKFLWNSVNAHGVHSPFVFHLVTKCFYKKTGNKVTGLLYRLVYYFRPDMILLEGEDVEITGSEILEAAEKLNITIGINSKAQSPKPSTQYPTSNLLLFISYKQKAAVQTLFEQLLPTVKNNTFWIINHIHSSPEMEDAWNTIKGHPQITVTIDVYHYGLVFFRREQKKEHFIIRPYRSVLLDAILGFRKLWGLIS